MVNYTYDYNDEIYPTEYPKENPFKVGDKVRRLSTGDIIEVGDQFGIRARWFTNGYADNIVTTDGAVLQVSDLELIKEV